MTRQTATLSQTVLVASRPVVSTMLQIDVYTSKPVVMPKLGGAGFTWREQASPTHLVLFIRAEDEPVVSHFLEELRAAFSPVELFVSIGSTNGFKVPS